MKKLALFSVVALLFSCKKKLDYPTTNTFRSPSKILVAGYLPDYGISRTDVSNLALLDRVYYFSVYPDTTTGVFKTFASDTANLNYLNSKLKPGQDLFITVGGWVKSKGIPVMAADSAVKRMNYITALMNFCKYFNVKGVDLDWEDYPAAVNRTLYGSFTKQLADSVHARGMKFSVALGDDANKANFGADVVDKIDNVNIMNYGGLDASNNHSTFTQMTSAITLFTNLKIPKSKIIVGVPFFGKRSGSGTNPPLTQTYSYIFNSAGTKPTMNESKTLIGSTAYAYNGRSLLMQKVDFLRYNAYAGITAWELSQDTTATTEYSLLKTIYDANPAATPLK
ncbi:glycoside hydrolase family 18 protein [Chitinophagaceae bacterium LB-8]|uniref:chitinase n=1 Tax=Paraflavisolibacter caeni TaxID=2982496 RepID=A0A9X3B745_9BACT|nr:glycoside hydrolase family 18 protein [Paraflavisolibacter caeni]MCU7548825.1 glycoside hydrolase family 18 protein [Paraflavisolibacter caeni]